MAATKILAECARDMAWKNTMPTALDGREPATQELAGNSRFTSAASHNSWVMKGGTPVEIRPIQPEDEQRMIQFHKGLSERSVYMRYFESLSFDARTAHARLARICFVDPERETVLIALCSDSQSVDPKIVAVARLSKLTIPRNAEVALLVLDEFQGRGLGTELLRRLLETARGQKITQIQGEMLRDNVAMQKVLKKLGFRSRLLDSRSVRAVLTL